MVLMGFGQIDLFYYYIKIVALFLIRLNLFIKFK